MRVYVIPQLANTFVSWLYNINSHRQSHIWIPLELNTCLFGLINGKVSVLSFLGGGSELLPDCNEIPGSLVLLVCAQVFFRYSGFLPQSRNRLVRLTGDSKLPSGMNEWYVHPAMDGWPVPREQKTKTNGWADRVNAVTSSLADCSESEQRKFRCLNGGDVAQVFQF